MTTKPYQLKFYPSNKADGIVLGRYETSYLARVTAELLKACVTEGEIQVEFNNAAPAVS